MGETALWGEWLWWKADKQRPQKNDFTLLKVPSGVKWLLLLLERKITCCEPGFLSPCWGWVPSATPRAAGPAIAGGHQGRRAPRAVSTSPSLGAGSRGGWDPTDPNPRLPNPSRVLNLGTGPPKLDTGATEAGWCLGTRCLRRARGGRPFRTNGRPLTDRGGRHGAGGGPSKGDGPRGGTFPAPQGEAGGRAAAPGWGRAALRC